MNILDEIINNKKIEIKKAKQEKPLKEIQKNLKKSTRNFYNALKGRNNIITELKFNSPSNGKIKTTKTISEIISIYDKYASAISILTDEKYFDGKLKYINEVKKYTKLPILRKDFIIDKYQIYEARKAGADAILLIASILSKEKIEEFLETAEDLGMDSLVEVREESELIKVLKTNAKIIGINNRNLKNFEINLDQTKKLKEKIPADKIVISESGIYTKEEIEDVNTNAVLIGTSLMNDENMEEKLQTLFRTKLKICGITNKKDAQMCIQEGVDFLGFNFYKKSKRYITSKKASEIISKLPNTIQSVGVFVNSTQEEIENIVNETKIDFIQLHGDENEELINYFSEKAINVFRIKDTVPKSKVLTFAKMFDTYVTMFGGSGKSFNLELIKNEKRKICIAGGINPENINKSIELKPFLIDVCSGVEITPGKKERKKIKLLIEVMK